MWSSEEMRIAPNIVYIETIYLMRDNFVKHLTQDMLADSSTGGFYKSFSTSCTCMLLDPIVSLHVHYQSTLLDKLLSTLFTVKLSDSAVHLFVAHANTCQAESL